MASPNPKGVNQYTERNDGDHHLSLTRGTTQRNILRRIKRDHPDIAAHRLAYRYAKRSHLN